MGEKMPSEPFVVTGSFWEELERTIRTFRVRLLGLQRAHESSGNCVQMQILILWVW